MGALQHSSLDSHFFPLELYLQFHLLLKQVMQYLKQTFSHILLLKLGIISISLLWCVNQI